MHIVPLLSYMTSYAFCFILLGLAPGTSGSRLTPHPIANVVFVSEVSGVRLVAVDVDVDDDGDVDGDGNDDVAMWWRCRHVVTMSM